VPPDNLDNLGSREDVVEKEEKEKKNEKKRYDETDSRTNTVANYIDTSLLREAAVYHVYIFINVCIIKYIRDKNLLTCYSERVPHSRYEQPREFTRENRIYGRGLLESEK
jgi:hypothetical protein